MKARKPLCCNMWMVDVDSLKICITNKTVMITLLWDICTKWVVVHFSVDGMLKHWRIGTWSQPWFPRIQRALQARQVTRV